MQLTFCAVPMRIPSQVLPMVWANVSCLTPCLRLLFALNGKRRSRMHDLYSASVEAYVPVAGCGSWHTIGVWHTIDWRRRRFCAGHLALHVFGYLALPLRACLMHAVTTQDLRSAILNVAGGRQRCRIVLLVTTLREVVQIESYRIFRLVFLRATFWLYF